LCIYYVQTYLTWEQTLGKLVLKIRVTQKFFVNAVGSKPPSGWSTNTLSCRFANSYAGFEENEAAPPLEKNGP
jgi:hypothetical protein